MSDTRISKDDTHYIIATQSDFDALVRRREALINDVASYRRSNLRAGRLNYGISLIILTVSVSTSALAGFLNFFSNEYRLLISLLAFTPTVTAIIETQFRFQEKANWFYRRKDAVDDVYFQFMYECPPPTAEKSKEGLETIASLSREWRTLNKDLSLLWEQQFSVQSRLSAAKSASPTKDKHI